MRWEMIETYEFHNPDYEGYIYSYDRRLKPIPDSLADRQCWITGKVNEIFTLDVANVTGSEYTYMPLHFVTNRNSAAKLWIQPFGKTAFLDRSCFLVLG